ncbi:hypothetical protein WN943_000267 [Citrus x changshan-huyou]
MRCSFILWLRWISDFLFLSWCGCGGADVMLFRERKDKADMGPGCQLWCDCTILPTWSSVVISGSRQLHTVSI